jgi:hypothetical protein
MVSALVLCRDLLYGELGLCRVCGNRLMARRICINHLPASTTWRLADRRRSGDIDTFLSSRDVIRPSFARTNAQEGAGKAGCPLHPQPRVREKSTRASHHRFAGHTRPSLRNGFNGLLRSLPGDRLGCLRRRGHAKASHRLGTSIGVSGRYDFAVHFRAARPQGTKTSTASRPAFVTMANAPLAGEMGRGCKADLPDGLSEIFLHAGLDTPITDLPVGQISPSRLIMWRRMWGVWRSLLVELD